MGPSQVVGGTETDPSPYIKTFLGLLGSVQHQGWKYLVTLDEAWFYFSNQRTNLALRPGRPANNSRTNDQQSEHNADSGVESAWIPLGISSAERTEVDRPILY
jgi:hypothetical protein